MKNIFLLIGLFVFLASCNNVQPCEKINAEKSQQVIEDYFQAISDKDFDKIKALSTNDYKLYEDALIWNNDSLIQSVKSMPTAVIKYDLSQFEIETDCNGAFINYFNKGIVTLNDTTTFELNWTESAYIKKSGNELKLDFLHSTRKRK